MKTFYKKPQILVFLIAIILSANCFAQQTDSIPSKKAMRAEKKQEKIDAGKLMITPLAGPAYTPELGFTIAGGIMTSFKTNKSDSLIQRSSAPIMLGVSSTGAFFVQTKWTTFWLEDKMRIYADVNFKTMPDNYWGVGYDAARNTEKGDSTTAYERNWLQFYPKILWQFKKNLFIGGIINLNYTKGNDASEVVANDPYYIKYNEKPFNSGLGAIFQYDSRDVPVNAWEGTFVEISSTFFSEYLGSQNNYQVYELDLRKYQQINRDGQTLAFQLRGRFGLNNIPYGEMSQPGTPFDLRGYTWGRYRDYSMLFALTEYRHMFLKSNHEMSPHGIVLFAGAGTIGQDASNFKGWLPCVGVGYRFQVQPRMNLRIDYGFGFESQGFYFNFNEAF
ncbi:MAG: BamA/TamA family outer membrane protein [Bacteroidota bacterium]|nr:MAG: BamA/TamA family outer membrane protein [Bacteroidota bacterium]